MTEQAQDPQAAVDNPPVVNNTDSNGAAGATDTPVEVNYDATLDRKEVKFNFRENKDLGGKRPPVELVLPVPSIQGLVAIFKVGGKQLDLLLEAAANVVIDQARSIINDDEKITGANNFPFDKVTWEFISNMPPKERRGGGIPKETWDAFIADYTTVMPTATGKTAEQVGNAAKLMATKFSTVKTAKAILALLKDQLTIYTTASPNAEQYMECVQFLTEKADTLLAVNDADLLQNL